MFFADRLTLDKPRRNADGFMAVHARSARSGVYQYLGREVDPDGKKFAADQVVNVYRPAEEVFDKASLGSFVGKPITDDHPAKPVTATNWRDLARGTIMGAAKDGEYVGFDLAFLDAATIRAVDSGKRELSNGYACELSFEDGTAPDGTAYQAVQRNIRGNHVALVSKGRAGSTCRIGDSATCEPIPSDAVAEMLVDERTYSDALHDDKNGSRNGVSQSQSQSGGHGLRQDGEVRMPHTLIIDGLQVPNVSDEAKAAIEKLQGQVTSLSDAKGTVDAQLVDANKALETEKGKVTALEQQVKDAAITPEKLEKMVADRAALVTQAKAIDPKIVTDGKTDIEIRKAVVTAKLGDAAKDMSDDAIAGAFAIAAKDVKVSDPVRDALSSKPMIVGDNASVRDAVRAAQYN